MREQRLYGMEIVRPRRGTNGTTPRVSRTGGEDLRLPGSRSPFSSRGCTERRPPARPCPRPGASSIRDRSSHSAAQFASGTFPQYDHVIEAFPAQDPNDSLHVRILPGTVRRNNHLLDVERLRSVPKRLRCHRRTVSGLTMMSVSFQRTCFRPLGPMCAKISIAGCGLGLQSTSWRIQRRFRGLVYRRSPYRKLAARSQPGMCGGAFLNQAAYFQLISPMLQAS